MVVSEYFFIFWEIYFAQLVHFFLRDHSSEKDFQACFCIKGVAQIDLVFQRLFQKANKCTLLYNISNTL